MWHADGINQQTGKTTTMCLITLNWQPATKTPLIVAANRDEFYARSALPMHRWPDSSVLAGKDLQAGGTWLGVAEVAGAVRFSALTNYRASAGHRPDAPTRGHITTTFLSGTMSAPAYLDTLHATASLYNPFNLIVFDGQALMGYESRHLRAFALPHGISAVSNADFNTPWPKLARLCHEFEQTLARHHGSPLTEHELFNLLANDAVAADGELPETGISLPKERALSAAFVRTPDYGTRACSVVQIGVAAASFAERRFDGNGFKGESRERLSLLTLDNPG